MSEREFVAPEWAIALLLHQAECGGLSVEELMVKARQALLDRSGKSPVAGCGHLEKLQIREHIEVGFARYSTGFGNG
ncbi:MAG: hypothetical protein F9K35_13685 [Burkholderiaceae bacterium]|nr:MAG: hypothetical protein F9K35_13685 [Burkholderiaceae bacterium]